MSWSDCFLSFARAWPRGKRLAILATELGVGLAQAQQEENDFFFVSGTLFLALLCCILQFLVLNLLVFQYYCSGVNVERVRGPTVSLGAAVLCRASRI